MFNPSSPVTGGAITGFTAPTYTLTADTAPDVNGKQWAVTALGGTQTGVTLHSVSSPFTLAFWKPKLLKLLPSLPFSNSIAKSIPRNVYKAIVRKGVTPNVGYPAVPVIVTIMVDCPAGAETYDTANVNAAVSLAAGAFYAQSAGVADTVKTNVS